MSRCEEPHALHACRSDLSGGLWNLLSSFLQLIWYWVTILGIFRLWGKNCAFKLECISCTAEMPCTEVASLGPLGDHSDRWWMGQLRRQEMSLCRQKQFQKNRRACKSLSITYQARSQGIWTGLSGRNEGTVKIFIPDRQSYDMRCIVRARWLQIYLTEDSRRNQCVCSDEELLVNFST